MLACIQRYFFCRQTQADNTLLNISLSDADVHNTETYIPRITYGKVIKVYDGDTITVAAYLPESNKQVYKFSIRLRGIDSPELRGSSDTEKKHAIVARDALSERILNQYIDIKNVSTEKYGRLLADVYFEGTNMNNWMVSNNYAVEYDGGTKHRDKSWDK